jgi:pimeloyl-ACP methyl ester carboxylesterase
VDQTATPRPLTAAVTHYAVTEPSALRADAFDNTEDEIAAFEAVMAAFFGTADRPTAVRQHLVDPATVPPFLVMHGDADRRVGFAQGQRLHRALEAAGVASTFVRVAGAGHGTPEWETEAVVGQVEAFLRQVWSRGPEQPGARAMP